LRCQHPNVPSLVSTKEEPIVIAKEAEKHSEATSA